MAKDKPFKWRCCSNQFINVNRATAERMAKAGEYVDPNPFFRERSEEEKAKNKEAAKSLGVFPTLIGGSHATTSR